MPEKKINNRLKFFREDLPFRIKPFEELKVLKKKHAKETEKSGGDGGKDTDTTIRDPYIGTTYLYIRAREEDNGTRPIDGTVWMSPDLNVKPTSGGDEICWGIEAGQHYAVECIVHNDGDTDALSTTVEIRLANPSVGWSVPLSKQLGIQNVFIPAFNSKLVTFDWAADFEDVGHRCMFARVYCLTPMDAPDDWDSFNVRNDRHIGQQNLNIVHSEDELDVDAEGDTGQNNGEFKIIIRPAENIPQKMQLIKGLDKIKLIKGITTIDFELKPRDFELTLKSDAELKKLGAIDAWTGKITGRKVAPLKLKIPKMNIDENEGHVYHVESVDAKTGKYVGGFTMIVLK